MYSVHVIVVSWFLQCMGYMYVPREGCTYPCTVEAMRQLSCTDRLCKANRRISPGARTSILHVYRTYTCTCALPIQRKVQYARRCSYSSIA